MSHIVPEAQIVLLTALNAFRDGWAKPPHFDVMLDTRDILLLGAKAKNEDDIAEAARAFNLALANIRESWDGDKFSVRDDDQHALGFLVDISNDFWNRQSGHLYQVAYLTLKEWRKEQHENQRQEGRADKTWMVCG
jgi:hypothetical protein